MNRDRGSVAIWAAALAGLVWLGCSSVLLYGSAVAERHKVETAADLAALAVAVHVPDGTSRACGVGANVASRNGGTLRDCRVVGGDVEVTVSRQVRLSGLGLFTTVTRARAGPVEVDLGP